MKILFIATLLIIGFSTCKKTANSTITINVTRPTDSQTINFAGGTSRQYWISGDVTSTKPLQKITFTVTNAIGVQLSFTEETGFQGEDYYDFDYSSYMSLGVTMENLTITIVATDESGFSSTKVVKYKLTI